MDPGSWTFPSFAEYYDADTNAVGRHSAELSSLAPDEAAFAIDTVKRVVTEYAADLSEDLLIPAAVSVADDLYKTVSWIDTWSSGTGAYVQAVFGSFFSMLSARGKLLRYIIENTYTDGLQRPLVLYPWAFNAAGCVYACPHAAAALIAKNDGVAVSNPPRLEELAPMIAEGRSIAAQVAARAGEQRRHFFYLELDYQEGSLDGVHSIPAPPGTITIMRDQAPTTGSKVLVSVA